MLGVIGLAYLVYAALGVTEIDALSISTWNCDGFFEKYLAFLNSKRCR